MAKTALVTGANRGIGLEISRQLLAKGWTVWLSVRSEEKGIAALTELGETIGKSRFMVMEASKEESIRSAFGLLEIANFQLDVLINNAAILRSESQGLLEAPPQDIYDTLHVNAIGPLLVIRHALPFMKEGGRIINVSSGAGEFCKGVNAYAPVYSFSKTALNTVTRHLSRDLQPRSISINAVCPGWVRTDMGGPNATRSVEKGAETPVWLATDAPASESGKFWRDKKEIAW